MKKIILLFILLQSVLGYSQSDSLLQRLKSSHGAKEEFKIWSNLADYYEYRGQMDSMRIAGEQMLSIGIQAKQDSLISSAYIVIGSYFAYVGDYNQSLVYLFKALNLSEECRSSSSICWAAKDIGIVYKSLRNFPEAIKYLRRAQDQLMNYVDPVDRNRTYTHLSECFLGLGQKDSALRYVQIANDVIIAGDDYGYARTLFIYASVYESSGDTDLAESYYKKCIAYALAHNVILPLANAAASYSNLLLNSGKYLPAKNYALQSLAASQQSSRKQDIINTAALLRTIYSQLGLKDSAYYYADMKDAYRDTVFNEQKIIQLQNIGFAQQIKEKEDQEKQVAQANERNQNLQYAAIVIALITFIILFFLLSRSIIVKTKFIEFFAVLGLLAVFEFINLFIHPYLSHATNDSPVLMLVVLIAIGALLIPLHHRLEKWIKEKMTEKNKVIRLAAAKKTIEKLEKKPEIS